MEPPIAVPGITVHASITDVPTAQIACIRRVDAPVVDADGMRYWVCVYISALTLAAWA